jgi:hypothetical protein
MKTSANFSIQMSLKVAALRSRKVKIYTFLRHSSIKRENKMNFQEAILLKNPTNQSVLIILRCK